MKSSLSMTDLLPAIRMKMIGFAAAAATTMAVAIAVMGRI
jgi:hypothetical protein